MNIYNITRIKNALKSWKKLRWNFFSAKIALPIKHFQALSRKHFYQSHKNRHCLRCFKIPAEKCRVLCFCKKRKNKVRSNKYHAQYFCILVFFACRRNFTYANFREKERAANDNIFGRARFSQWDLQVTSSFSIITKYMGRDPLFWTMHSAYINNQRTFFFFVRPLPEQGLFTLPAQGRLWKFRETFRARTWSHPPSFFFFSSEQAKKIS